MVCTPNFFSQLGADDRQKLLEGHQQIRSRPTQVDSEFRIARPDGELLYVRMIFEAVRNDRGAVVSVAGATQDMTDQKRSQEQTFARQKLESVGTLASETAHDFNNL